MTTRSFDAAEALGRRRGPIKVAKPTAEVFVRNSRLFILVFAVSGAKTLLPQGDEGHETKLSAGNLVHEQPLDRRGMED